MARKNRAEYPLDTAVLYAAAIIRKHGYISKKAAEDSGRVSTSQHMGTWFKSPAPPNSDNIAEEDHDRAAEAKKWLQDMGSHPGYESEGDFVRSMRKLVHGGYHRVAAGYVTASDFGFIACVWSTMEREKNRETKKQEQVTAAENSEFMGKVKQRAEFFVKLVERNYSDRMDCYIYKVKDRDGNLGVFFSNDDKVAGVNDCFLAKMTPKRHSVSSYHGGKETVFNRVKVLQNVGAPKES